MHDNRPAKETAIAKTPLLWRLSQWRVVILILAGYAIFASPMLYRHWLFRQVPDIGDPFDVDAFGTVELAEEENAKFDYEAAVALLVPLPRMRDEVARRDMRFDILDDALAHGWEYAAPEIRQWLEDNRPAMERWKIGTEKPGFLYRQPKDARINFGISDDLRDALKTFRDLCTLESSRLLSERKPNEAWTWARAALRGSRHLGQHGSERGHGYFLHNMGMKAAKEIVDDPLATEQLLQEMLHEAQQIYLQTPLNSTTVKHIYLELKNTLWDDDEYDISGSSFFENARNRVIWFYGIEPGLSQLVAQQYAANVLDQVDLPLHEWQPRTAMSPQQRSALPMEMFTHDPAKTYDVKIMDPAEISRWFARTLVLKEWEVNLTVYLKVAIREAAWQRSLELSLALQIYHRRHGHYPDHLERLVEASIIDEVPLDPFSPVGAPMRYRRLKGDAYVWSISDNGVDDGGLHVDSENHRRWSLDRGLHLGGGVEAPWP